MILKGVSYVDSNRKFDFAMCTHGGSTAKVEVSFCDLHLGDPLTTDKEPLDVIILPII